MFSTNQAKIKIAFAFFQRARSTMAMQWWSLPEELLIMILLLADWKGRFSMMRVDSRLRHRVEPLVKKMYLDYLLPPPEANTSFFLRFPIHRMSYEVGMVRAMLIKNVLFSEARKTYEACFLSKNVSSLHIQNYVLHMIFPFSNHGVSGISRQKQDTPGMQNVTTFQHLGAERDGNHHEK